MRSGRVFPPSKQATAPPKKNRAALKKKGSMCDTAAAWAVPPAPQIIVAAIISKLPL
jgi:hypothetical protein